RSGRLSPAGGYEGAGPALGSPSCRGGGRGAAVPRAVSRPAPVRPAAGVGVNVRPLDPQRCPGADRGAGGPERRQPRTRGRERDPVRVEHDEELGQVAIVADGVDSKATVDVRTPVKFDLDIKTSGTGCVKIQKIECDNCKIETEKGTSVLQSIKCQNLNTSSGDEKYSGISHCNTHSIICYSTSPFIIAYNYGSKSKAVNNVESEVHVSVIAKASRYRASSEPDHCLL
uniref:Family with sequence similarity 185 member A n=1 Tax=Malurus cyaneus samueli TaxID=2593467 RepID=A0A8C5TP62_9PASS